MVKTITDYFGIGLKKLAVDLVGGLAGMILWALLSFLFGVSMASIQGAGVVFMIALVVGLFLNITLNGWLTNKIWGWK